MKLKTFVLSFIFLASVAAGAARAQSSVTGSITGRIVTANGTGVRRASVTVMNLTTFETQTRIANDFGYFRFNDLPIINLYVVTVGSKRHSFNFASQLVQFTDLEHNLLFIAEE
ncbi:MAG TPA: carboxypeptidase-like regulatory domain-containing protein [Pyrinomonadaceae bacterium]